MITLHQIPANVTIKLVNGQHRISSLLSLLSEEGTTPLQEVSTD